MSSGRELVKQDARERPMKITHSVESIFHLLLLLIGEVNFRWCKSRRGNKFEVGVAEGGRPVSVNHKLTE